MSWQTIDLEQFPLNRKFTGTHVELGKPKKEVYALAMAKIASEGYQPEPVFGFDQEKAVQIVGFFLGAANESLDKLKLIKLLYLADRRSFSERGKPLNFDDYYSMPHGPVPSSALNGINGQLADAAWAKIALAGDNKTVVATEEIDTDRLSRADRAILDAVWEEFGTMSAWQLRNWTHKNCPEYTEVGASRISIDVDEILEAVGQENADARAHDLKRMQRNMGKLARACGT